MNAPLSDRARSAASALRLGVALPMALLFCAMAIVPPSMDELVRDRFAATIKGADSRFMLAHSLPSIAMLGMLFGFLSDRLGRRLPLAALGLFGTGVATASLPFIHSFPALLVVRFFDGLLAILAVGLLMARAADLADPANRARTMGVVIGAIPLGYLLGNLLVGTFGPRLGTTVIFPLVGALVAAAGIAVAAQARHPESLRAHAPGPRAWAATLRNMPRLWVPMLFGTIDKFTFAVFAIAISALVGERFGGDTARWTGLVMGGFWLAFLLASPLVVMACRRWSLLGLLSVSSLAYGGLLTAIGFNHSLPVLFVLLAGCGVITAIQYIANVTLVAALAGPDERATAMQAFEFTGAWGMFIGFAVLGIIGAHATPGPAFGMAGVLETLCALVGGSALLLAGRGRQTSFARNSTPVPKCF